MDARFTVVEESIHEAFKQLSLIRDPDRITVSEIIKTAGIARSTFYMHYEDMPALKSAFEDGILNDIFGLMVSFHPSGNREACISFFRNLCEYVMNNGALRRILRSPDADSFVSKAVGMLHKYVTSTVDYLQQNSPQPESSTQTKAYEIAYSVGGCVGILHKWTNEGCSDDSAYIAGILADATCTYFGWHNSSAL
jgi:AcrR family transcriptional regulator